MDYMTEIKYWLNIILSPISLILNLVLFFLIMFHSSKNIKNYKKVLYLGWLTDFVFAFWNILLHPDMKVVGNIYAVMSCGFLGHLPGALTAWLFLGSIFLMYFSIVNVSIQFLYRYLLLCWKITLNSAAFMVLVAVSISPILAYIYFFAIHLITRTKSDESYAHLLNESDWVKNGKLPPFGAYQLEAIANALYISFSLTIAACIIVILCGIEIFRNILQTSDKISQSTRMYQKQITIVMTIEAIVPFVTVVFPTLLDVTAVMFGYYVPWAGKIAFLLGGLAPVINPLIKISVIQCYRRKTLELLHLRRSSTTTTSVHVFITQGSSK